MLPSANFASRRERSARRCGQTSHAGSRRGHHYLPAIARICMAEIGKMGWLPRFRQRRRRRPVLCSERRRWGKRDASRAGYASLAAEVRPRRHQRLSKGSALSQLHRYHFYHYCEIFAPILCEAEATEKYKCVTSKQPSASHITSTSRHGHGHCIEISCIWNHFETVRTS